MIAEVEKVLHVYHIVVVVFILPSDGFQDPQLHQGLVVKSEVIGEWQGGWGMRTENTGVMSRYADSPFSQPPPQPQPRMSKVVESTNNSTLSLPLCPFMDSYMERNRKRTMMRNTTGRGRVRKV